MFERQVSMRRLTEHLSRTAVSDSMAFRLCSAAATMLHLDGGSITMGWDTASHSILCATNRAAKKLENVQEVLGEGPSFDAHRTQTAVEVSGGDARIRWPVLVDEVLEELGDEPHLLSLPIRPETLSIGILTMHARQRPRPANDMLEVQFIADAIGVAVLAHWEDLSASPTTWQQRDKINQAAGMVVAQMGVSPDDALAVLRTHAFAHDATLEAVATEVIERKVGFEFQEAGGEPESEGNND